MMFVIEPGDDSWRQVARVVAKELPRLDADLLVAPAHTEEQMKAFMLPDIQTVFVCEDDAARKQWSERLPEIEIIGKPHKTPPLAPASPLPLELLKVSAGMLTPGMRECLHIGRLALLNEITEGGRAIICVGGGGERLDTAVLLRPGLRGDNADAHILETLCAPYET